jgi:transcriptional regulator with XRE-family HTH domain
VVVLVLTLAGSGLVARLRRASGLSQAELARRAGTSRPTLSAYEHGSKSPSLDTVERLAGAAGQDLEFRPKIAFQDVAGPRGRTVQVPARLPRLEPNAAFAEIELPLTLNWSQPGRVFRLADRGDRARLYELVLREGAPEDILRFVDGVLLVDLWAELMLPKYLRGAWEPLIQNAINGSVDGLAS